jgi:predicted histidine transporter YuiF (NhaC family)
VINGFILAVMGMFVGLIIGITSHYDKEINQINQRLSCLESDGKIVIDYSMPNPDDLKVVYKCMKNNQLLFQWEKK